MIIQEFGALHVEHFVDNVPKHQTNVQNVSKDIQFKMEIALHALAKAVAVQQAQNILKYSIPVKK